MAQRPIRNVDYSSDSEEDSTVQAPNQALPIANLPFNFNGIPQDGMEYLFTVRFSLFFLLPFKRTLLTIRIVKYRRDSRLLPRFTRVDHPTTNTPELPLAEEPVSKTLHSAFPSEEWRMEYVQHFLNYRQNLRRALHAPNAPGKSTPTKVQLPNWQNRNEWWRFITGSPRKDNDGTTVTNAGDDDDTKSGHEPTLAMLKQFSLRNVTGLLYWFSVWITDYTDSLEDAGVQSSEDENRERSGPDTTTESVRAIEGIHQRWMFALLGMLDSELVGNDISTLRVLARAAIRLVQLLTKDDVHPDPGAGVVDPEGAIAASGVRSLTTAKIAGCWMVVAAIVGVWGQRDIWDEAQEALSTSS